MSYRLRGEGQVEPSYVPHAELPGLRSTGRKRPGSGWCITRRQWPATPPSEQSCGSPYIRFARARAPIPVAGLRRRSHGWRIGTIETAPADHKRTVDPELEGLRRPAVTGARRLGAATGPSYPYERAAASERALNGPKPAMGRALSSREPRPIVESRAECVTVQQAIASSSDPTFPTVAPRRRGAAGLDQARRGARRRVIIRRGPPQGAAGTVARGARLVGLVPSLARRRLPPLPPGSTPGPVNGSRAGGHGEVLGTGGVDKRQDDLPLARTAIGAPKQPLPGPLDVPARARCRHPASVATSRVPCIAHSASFRRCSTVIVNCRPMRPRR